MATDTELLNKRKLNVKKAGAMLKQVEKNSEMIESLMSLNKENALYIILDEHVNAQYFPINSLPNFLKDLKKTLVDRRELLWAKVRNEIADYLREENELLNKQIKTIVNNG